MDRNVDFSKLSNAEINLKIMGYDNEYQIKKDKIIELVRELEDLDFLYKRLKMNLIKEVY